jgi:serine/threonine-protein kinase
MSAQSRYKRVALIGEGGMAQVFLTLSDELGASKLAVVKQLRPELANDGEHRGMFLDEARIAVKLHHPNIVQTFEVGERDGSYFMAMEYLEGQPLNVVLSQAAREHFPLLLHLHVIREVLRGLAYAHELTDFDGKPLQIVHRDISPHNVFLTYDGLVKIVDFGIAKAKSSTQRTQTGVFKGKPTYSSPEQALGEAVNQRADVFSVGVVLWEALARRRMWGDRADTAVLGELVNGRSPKLADAAPDAPPELVAMCERALQFAADDRYATSRDFLNALEPYVDARTTPNAASKELGERVSSLFSSERERLRRTIEEQVRIAESVSAIRATERSGSARLPTLLELAGLTSLGTGSGDRLRAAPRTNRSRTVLLGGVAAAALAGIGAWAFAGTGSSGKHGGAPLAATPAQMTASPTASITAAMPSTVRLEVQTDPQGASVLLDGQPFDPTKDLAKGPSSHRLTVSAPGYEARTLDVVFDRDQSLSVALRPDATAAPAAHAAPVTGSRGTAAKAKKRLDEESPYQ